MKVCSKCKQELPATTEYFHRHRGTADGLRSECRKCKDKQGRRYYQRYYRKYRQTLKGKRLRKKADKKHRHTIRGHLGQVYSNINKRCNNPKNGAYHWYGGRGIRNKFNSLDDFRDYIINTLGYDTYEKIKGLEIDRIDNDGHYERGNIRFVTHSENNRNRRDSKS